MADLERRFDELRAWLRAHGDYDVSLNLWGLYGCYRVAVTHLGREVWSDLGEGLPKRLELALAFCQSRVDGSP